MELLALGDLKKGEGNCVILMLVTELLVKKKLHNCENKDFNVCSLFGNYVHLQCDFSLGHRTGLKYWSGLKTGRSQTGHARNIIIERASAVEVSKIQ